MSLNEPDPEPPANPSRMWPCQCPASRPSAGCDRHSKRRHHGGIILMATAVMDAVRAHLALELLSCCTRASRSLDAGSAGCRHGRARSRPTALEQEGVCQSPACDVGDPRACWSGKRSCRARVSYAELNEGRLPRASRSPSVIAHPRRSTRSPVPGISQSFGFCAFALR